MPPWLVRRRQKPWPQCVLRYLHYELGQADALQAELPDTWDNNNCLVHLAGIFMRAKGEDQVNSIISY